MSRKAPPSPAPDKDPANPPEKSVRASRRFYPFLAFGLIAAGLAAMALLPDLRAFRYSSKYKDYAASVFCDDRDVDVAFFGTSRMARAVDAGEIARVFEQQTGTPLSIVDLAKPGGSNFAWVQMLSDLLEHRRVKLIVVEMGNPRRQPQWKQLDKLSGVLKSPELIDYALNVEENSVVENLFSLFEARLGSLEAGLGSLWLGCDGLNGNIAYDPTLGRYRQKGPFSNVDKLLAELDTNPINQNLFNPKYKFSLKVAKTILALAEEHGTKVIFVNLNSIDEDQLQQKHMTRFQEKYGAELTAWPEALMALFRTEFSYADRNHLDEDGARLVAPWFAEKVDEYLSRGN